MYKVERSQSSDFDVSKNDFEIVKKAVERDCIELLDYMLGCLSVSEMKLVKEYEESLSNENSNDNTKPSELTPEELKLIKLIQYKQSYRKKELEARLAHEYYPLPQSLLEAARGNVEAYLTPFYGCLSHDAQLEGQCLLAFALNQKKSGSAALFLDLECYPTSANKDGLDKLVPSHYGKFEVMKKAIKKFLTKDVPEFVNDMREALSDYQDILDFRHGLPEKLQKLFYNAKKSEERLHALIQIESELNWVSYSKRGAHYLYNSAMRLSESSLQQDNENSQLFKRVKPLLMKARNLMDYAQLAFDKDSPSHLYKKTAYTHSEVRERERKLEGLLRLQSQNDKPKIQLSTEGKVTEEKDKPKKPSPTETKKDPSSIASSSTAIPTSSPLLIPKPTSAPVISSPTLITLATSGSTTPVSVVTSNLAPTIEDAAKETTDSTSAEPGSSVSTQEFGYGKVLKPSAETMKELRDNGRTTPLNIPSESIDPNSNSSNANDLTGIITSGVNIVTQKVTSMAQEASTNFSLLKELNLPGKMQEYIDQQKQLAQLYDELKQDVTILRNNKLQVGYVKGKDSMTEEGNRVVMISLYDDGKIVFTNNLSQQNQTIFDNFKKDFISYVNQTFVMDQKQVITIANECSFKFYLKLEKIDKLEKMLENLGIKLITKAKDNTSDSAKSKSQDQGSKPKSDNNNNNQDDTAPKYNK